MDKKTESSARNESLCPCKSTRAYGECCGPYHSNKKKPETAEQLMRSRYSAYFFRKYNYLVETTHPDSRSNDLKKSISKANTGVGWSFLKVLGTSKGGRNDKSGKVEFVAEYYVNGEIFEMHECSRFRKFQSTWKYLDDRG
ncbi:SecC motif-containing protein [Puniceicoccaceae bacterium K14]|nr:SecC motif-containing protein [Puniceicoccaceae bacterium K14]